MVAVCSSKTLVSAYKSTRRHNPDKLFSTFDFYSVQLLQYLLAGEEAPRRRRPEQGRQTTNVMLSYKWFPHSFPLEHFTDHRALRHYKLLCFVLTPYTQKSFLKIQFLPLNSLVTYLCFLNHSTYRYKRFSVITFFFFAQRAWSEGNKGENVVSVRPYASYPYPVNGFQRRRLQLLAEFNFFSNGQCSKWAGVCRYTIPGLLFVPESNAGTYFL
jgi:hypothetical protein